MNTGHVPYRMGARGQSRGFSGPHVDAPHWVYELFDADGRHAYIGCTSNIGQRLTQHAAKDWWTSVARIKTSVYPTMRAGLDAERALIEQHQPPNNGTFTDKSPSNGWSRKKAEDAAAHEADLLCNRTYCKRGCNQRAHDLRVQCAKPQPSFIWNGLHGRLGQSSSVDYCGECIDYLPADLFGDMVETTCWNELAKRLGSGRKASYLRSETPNYTALEALAMHEDGADVEQLLLEDRERYVQWSAS